MFANFFITIKFYQICIIVRTLVRNLSILTTFNWRSCDWVSFMSPSNSPAQEIHSESIWAASNGPSADIQSFNIFTSTIKPYLLIFVLIFIYYPTVIQYHIFWIWRLRFVNISFSTNLIFELSNILSPTKNIKW